MPNYNPYIPEKKTDTSLSEITKMGQELENFRKLFEEKQTDGMLLKSMCLDLKSQVDSLTSVVLNNHEDPNIAQSTPTDAKLARATELSQAVPKEQAQ